MLHYAKAEVFFKAMTEMELYFVLKKYHSLEKSTKWGVLDYQPIKCINLKKLFNLGLSQLSNIKLDQMFPSKIASVREVLAGGESTHIHSDCLNKNFPCLGGGHFL